jgi:hypothetical protein
VGTFFSSGSLTPQHEDQVVVAITVIIKTAPTIFFSPFILITGEKVCGRFFWFAFPPVASPKQQKIELGRER